MLHILSWRNLAQMFFATLVLVCSTASAQTVTNSGFETPPFPGGVGYGAIPGWSASGPGGSGVNDSTQPFINGIPIPEGTHVAFQQGQGTLSQTVTGLTVGKSYMADFMIDERGAGGAGSSTAPFAQLNGGTVYSRSGYERRDRFEREITSSFTATGTTTTLAIGNSGGVGDNSLLLDAVSVRRSAPTPSNFDFDKVVIAPSTFQYTPGGMGWSFAGGSGVSRNGSGFQNGGVNALEGNQIAFMQQATSMTQTLTGFELGASYAATFVYAGRVGGTSNNLLMSLDSSIIYTNGDVSSSSWSAGATSTFIATQTSYTFTVAATNPLGGDRTTFVDDIRFFLMDENDAPTANAGGPYVYDASNLTRTLNGSGTDPENMALTYAWTQAGNPIGTGPTPSVGLALSGLSTTTSTTSFQLVTTDPGGLSSGAASAGVSYQNVGPSVASASATTNPNYSVTFSGSFADADLVANGLVSSFEDLIFEFDLTQATLPGQVGDGFLVGATAPTQTTNGLLSGTLSLSQLISLFGGLGTYTAWANVRDAAGLIASQSFTVNVVPEPSSLLVWSGFMALAAGAGWRRRPGQ